MTIDVSKAARWSLARHWQPRADKQREGFPALFVVLRGQQTRGQEATVSTTRKRALPLIIWSYASAAFSIG